MRKSDLYRAKLLREAPTHTQGGIPITIHRNGYGVKTWSTRYKKGGKDYSYYLPMDYPTLFGWNRNDPEFQLKPVVEGEVMTKVSVGDYVYHNRSYGQNAKNGIVIGDRGGHVGRWAIKMDDENIHYASSRDLTVIIPANPKEYEDMSHEVEHHLVPVPVEVEPGEPTLEEKVDLIMEHLGIQIERVPSSLVVTRVGEDESATEDKAPQE